MISTRSSSSIAVLLALGACDFGPEPPGRTEHAWIGSHTATIPQGAAADTDSAADPVVYGMYAEVNPDGRADGILTILNDTTRWRYDPYRGLVDGFMTRDTLNVPDYMLAELTREHDGAACRLQGPVVDTLGGLWDAVLSCGGTVMDSVQLLPSSYGFVTGLLTQGFYNDYRADLAAGARVQYCAVVDDNRFDIRSCKTAGYTDDDGMLRLRVPPGDWFVLASYWDDDDWDYCRGQGYNPDVFAGQFVTVRAAQAADASAHCYRWY